MRHLGGVRLKADARGQRVLCIPIGYFRDVMQALSVSVSAQAPVTPPPASDRQDDWLERPITPQNREAIPDYLSSQFK